MLLIKELVKFGSINCKCFYNYGSIFTNYFLEDEAGQLFKDIAIAVVASVTFSLFVSISVIPMLWKKFASISGKEPRGESGLTRFGNKFVNAFMKIVNWSLKSVSTKVITIGKFISFSVLTIWALFPKWTIYLKEIKLDF